jgi:hypothetical protein
MQPIVLARQAKTSAGVTLNDVVVAACTSALRTFLEARGDDPPLAR